MPAYQSGKPITPNYPHPLGHWSRESQYTEWQFQTLNAACDIFLKDLFYDGLPLNETLWAEMIKNNELPDIRAKYADDEDKEHFISIHLEWVKANIK